jgi:hypothetical protein
MVDSQRGVIRPDGGNDAHARLLCWYCDKSVYVYAENSEKPVTIADLPSFCRYCGKAFEVWTLEYHREWDGLNV